MENLSKIEVERPARPKSSYEEFVEIQRACIDQFETNHGILKLKSGAFTINDYHNILLTIFHQTEASPSSFALAGAMCPQHRWRAKSYLIMHAEEEKTHWSWIIEDLRASGYRGEDPRSLPATPPTGVYLGYAHYLALKQPLSRLAMAAVLEGISGAFGSRYASVIVKTLGLSGDHTKFYSSHGSLDVGHTNEILEVLKSEDLSPEKWGELTQAARSTGYLYKSMYDYAFQK